LGAVVVVVEVAGAAAVVVGDPGTVVAVADEVADEPDDVVWI